MATEGELATIATKENLNTLEQPGDWFTPRRIVLAFAALFLLNLLLRVFYLRYYFVNGDEAIRALTATNLLDGGRLYVDIVTDKPPGTTFFYAAVFALFGKSMIAVHVAAALWNFLTAVVLYFTAAHIYSRRAGLWAALFYVYFSASYLTQDMLAANTELLMVLPLTASFYLYLRSLSDKSTTFSPFLLAGAGASTGVATLFKQLGILNVACFVLTEAFIVYRLRKSKPLLSLISQALKRLLLVAFGILVVFAALTFWLYSQHSLADFWRYVFVMNKFYVSALSTSLWLNYMIGRVFAYIAFNLPLWVLAGWAAKRALASLKTTETDNRSLAEEPLLIWTGICLVAVFIGGRFFGHYFIQLLPALSILAARGAELLRVNLEAGAKRRKAILLFSFLLLCLLINLVRFHSRTAILAYETLTGRRTAYSQQWGMSQRENEAAIIAGRVRERLKANEPFYIWGYALDVYWRSGCPPASRFITPNHITGEYESATGSVAEADHEFWSVSRRQFLADLESNRPPLILDVTGELPGLPYDDIKTFIEQHYQRDGEIGMDAARPFILYRRLSP
jgi:4-amino-4-deoxy-L-arabinose transferase-like glycosyltransferase